MRDHPAAVYDTDVVGKRVGFLQVLGGEDDRFPQACSYALPDLAAAARVETVFGSSRKSTGRSASSETHRSRRRRIPLGVALHRTVGGVGQVKLGQLPPPPSPLPSAGAGADNC